MSSPKPVPRAKKPRRPDVVKLGRIAHIAQMMRDLTFRRGVTAKELARTWKLHISTVEDMTAEASRIVMAEVTNPTEVSLDVGRNLAKLIEDAHASKDYKSVIQASKVWADITVGRRYRVETEPVDKLSDAELVAIAEEQIQAMKKGTK